MKSKNLINEQNFKLKLNKAHYNDIGLTKEEALNLKTKRTKLIPEIKDHYKVVGFTNKGVEVEFIRKKHFKPEALYKIEVSISVFYGIHHQSPEVSLSKLEAELEARKNQLLAPPAHHASLLISNITSVNTNSLPIITPPIMKSENKQDKDSTYH
ncbi:hypothetical protein PRVXH_002523 [Proteinivorax hydrogeniformans]|uniref:Uncharacterized protein n=1 Tax=Proteinivorax hydrogeniformans TaxID=1826727 RepID=A0AAU8HTJ7_9FIRM